MGTGIERHRYRVGQRRLVRASSLCKVNLRVADGSAAVVTHQPLLGNTCAQRVDDGSHPNECCRVGVDCHRYSALVQEICAGGVSAMTVLLQTLVYAHHHYLHTQGLLQLQKKYKSRHLI